MDHWRFTPNIFDSGSFAFSSLMNQHSGYYTPTANAISMACHTQAGDLHTPGMAFQLGTPLSLPASEGQILSTTTVGMHAFDAQLMNSGHYSDPHVFAPPQSYAPSSFLHQDTRFEPLDASNDDVPVQDIKTEPGPQPDAGPVSLPPGTLEVAMAAPPKPSSERSVFSIASLAPGASVGR